MENEIALKNFLFDIEDVKKLNDEKIDINFFKILKLQRQELKHSNFLGWLFDPNGSHQLGSTFIETLLFNFIKDYDDIENVSIFDLYSMDFSDLIVYREYNNIDLLLVSKKSNFCLVIENKIDSKEHDNQLKRYYEFVENEYENYKKIYIYLTPDRSESSINEIWKPLSYEDIYYDINESIKEKNLNQKIAIYIEDYLQIIRSEFMDNEELRKKCQEIYFKHKEAIDLIVNYIPDEYYERYKDIKAALEKYDDKIEIITDSTTYLRFVSKKIKNIMPRTSDVYWISTGDFLVYEIKNKKNDNCVLQLLIGPAEDDIRKKCYDLVKTKFTATKKYNNKFNQIESLVLAKKPDENGNFPDSNEDAIKKLNKYMENNFSKNDDFFESAKEEIKKWKL